VRPSARLAEHRPSELTVCHPAQSPLYGDKTLPMGDEFGRHRRLIYRSKQRGWLELDLLLGEFALFQLPEYSDGQLDLWEEILDVENPDLYKYLTLQLPSPAGLMVRPSPSLRTSSCQSNRLPLLS
jgi:succinate dehydrogenase flavin-adding protein (antitoxin of CptAB toxin-antitoxin module)